MAEIALMICAVSSLSASVGGGFYLFKKEQENAAKEELIAEKKASPYVTAFFECDFKGDGQTIGEGAAGETTIQVGTPIKSIIVPVGYEVDMYSQKGYKGSKLSRRGPFDQKCTTIKSMVVRPV